jgi:hypothetical protein
MVSSAPVQINFKKNGTSGQLIKDMHFAYVHAYEIIATLVSRVSQPKKLTYKEMYVT